MRLKTYAELLEQADRDRDSAYHKASEAIHLEDKVDGLILAVNALVNVMLAKEMREKEENPTYLSLDNIADAIRKG